MFIYLLILDFILQPNLYLSILIIFLEINKIKLNLRSFWEYNLKVNKQQQKQKMSISMKLPNIEWLPVLFSEQFIQQIQYKVKTKEELYRLLSSHQPEIQPNKNLPIVKEQFFKHLVKKQSVLQQLGNIYTFMTANQYTVEQKHHIFNLVYKLVYFISEIAMTKEEWKIMTEKQVNNLTKRIIKPHSQGQTYQNQSLPSFQIQLPILTIHEAEQLLAYINNNILSFYQLWEKLLDQNQKFTVSAKFYNPIENKQANINLSEGKKLQVQEILELSCLKQYFNSEKPPVQEKKDPKKK